MMTLVRPFVLNTEPIVGLLNLYTFLATFPLAFQNIYGFNSGEEDLAFMGLFVGPLLSYLGFCVYDYYSLEPLFERKGGSIDPGDCLIPAMVGCWCIPVCLFGFGWTSVGSIHWIVPIIFSSVFSIGTFLLFQAILCVRTRPVMLADSPSVAVHTRAMHIRITRHRYSQGTICSGVSWPPLSPSSPCKCFETWRSSTDPML